MKSKSNPYSLFQKMDIAIKDKWLNLDAKCRLCSKLFCCPDHRIAHEDILHPGELRKVLATLSRNHNISVRNVKGRPAACTSPKAFKTPPTPASTRKRKREAAPVPQHLLQTLSKKKRRSNILPHLRTPRETPKSPLAIINNGVKNEIVVENNTGMSATKALRMKTSSPFAAVNNAEDFISMTPIENRSPETMGVFDKVEVSLNRVELIPESGNNHMVTSEISDKDISTNDSAANFVDTELNTLKEANNTEAPVTQSTDASDEIKDSSLSLQDLSIPPMLNSSDGNFSNGSNRSGNLSGFQIMLSPPDSDYNVDAKIIDVSSDKDSSCLETGSPIDVKKEVNLSNEQSKQDTMDEIFMTPKFNYESENQNESIDEFRTPSEWENSTSVLRKYESKTPKCPVVHRTPKVLEHRIRTVEKSLLSTVVEGSNGNTITVASPLKEIQNNDANYKGQTTISGTVTIHQLSFEFNNPEHLIALIQNPENVCSKRDSGFQSLDMETSNMQSSNQSNRATDDTKHSTTQGAQASNNSQALPVELGQSLGANNESLCCTSSPLRSPNNSDNLSCNISLRDCNMGQEFSLRLEPGALLYPNLNLSDPETALSDSFICLNEDLKMHPNINYERRNKQDLLNCTFEQFDINKFNESDLMMSPPKPEENESSMEITEASEAQGTIESIGYIDSETKEIFIPVKCFESDLSTIHEISFERSVQNQSMMLPPKRNSSNFNVSLMSISSIQDGKYQEYLQQLDESTIVKNIIPNENTVINEASENETVEENTKIELKTNKCENVTYTVSEAEIQSSGSVTKDSDGENNVSIGTLPSELETSSRNERSLSVAINYTISLKNIQPKESSLLVKYYSSFKKNLVSLLPFCFRASKSYTVVDLDNFDYGDVNEHIRPREPIRQYVTTLETSRKLIHPIEGQAPYYSSALIVKTLKEEIKGSAESVTPLNYDSGNIITTEENTVKQEREDQPKSPANGEYIDPERIDDGVPIKDESSCV